MSAEIEVLRPALEDTVAELSLELPQTQVDALLAYLALLQRWNATYNLTAVRDPAQMLTQHVADCLAVIAPLRRERGAKPTRLLDVGSGGGLPGVVIAILNPAIEVTCIDTVGKKAAFIRQVIAELRLPHMRSMHGRVEQMGAEAFDVVTARAFSSLSEFTRLSRACLAADGVWMAMKAREPTDEIAQLPSDIEVFHVEQLAVPGLDAQRCMVWMRQKR